MAGYLLNGRSASARLNNDWLLTRDRRASRSNYQFRPTLKPGHESRRASSWVVSYLEFPYTICELVRACP
jgi:hypothetical protein